MSVFIHCSGFRVGRERLRRLAEKVLAIKGVEGDVEVVFVGKNDIRRLNRHYLGKDRPTDVLAFPFPDKDFILPSKARPLLGQVFICYPQAIAQAKKYGHPREKELSLLLIHGILHLLGFKDEREEEKDVMRAEEQRLLALIN